MSKDKGKSKLDFNGHKLSEEKFVEVEQRYRTLVDSMSEGLLQVDNDDVVIYANRKFCEMSVSCLWWGSRKGDRYNAKLGWF